VIDADGEVLGHVRDGHLAPDDPLLRRIISQPLQGLFSGHTGLGGAAEELVTYQQIPGYPVWVGMAVDRSALTERWLASVAVYAAAAVAGTLALAFASVLAMRRARAERDALDRLRLETERRLHAEQRISSAQRMEVVGQLAARVAHDFNNVLTVVVGSLDLIAKTTSGNEKVQALAAAALQASQRAARLTSCLLSFAGRQIMLTRKLDMNALIAEFLPVIRQSIGDTIDVELDLVPGLPLCTADSAQLEAALLNVAINARDAMEHGGTLIIATRNAGLHQEDLGDVPETVAGGFIAVAMTDTGSGMAPEVASKAFAPFFTTKGVGKGSGLGLSQVLGFVRQLGGHLTLESKPGRGSTVTLFLPMP
jgi:signal transduction histidine kinase